MNKYKTALMAIALIFTTASPAYAVDCPKGTTYHEPTNSCKSSAAPIPEPSTLVVFALGMMGLAARRFKK